MLKKILNFLLILLAILILLALGWVSQVYYDWPAGSMYLWPIIAFSVWGLFILLRKFWVKYRAAQRLKTQLPVEELAAADPDWSAGVQQLLAAQNNQGDQFHYVEELTLSNDLPHLQAFITWLDNHVVEILNGKRWLFLLDFDWTHKLLIRIHQNLVDTLERNKLNFLSVIPGVSSLFGKTTPQRSVLGPHKIHFVLGMSGSGKSTLLQRSSFGAHIGETNPDATITPTKSCRLAFLEAGIMVEVSGRHVDPNANATECDTAWSSLLASISADINSHQIASIVVCISAEELNTIHSGNIHQGIQLIRRRISDLMALSGKRLPVYLVLTKVDLIGFTPLIEALPENLLAQPAGDLLPSDQIIISGTSAQDSISVITRYLPWLAMRSAAGGFEPGKSALMAVHGLLGIQESLESAFLGLFGASNYLETSIYRGLFLSSDLSRAGIELDRQSDAPRLAFGSGVLNDVLLRDRIFQPLTSYERKIKHRQKMMWTAYYSVVALILMWMSAGFIYQSNQMFQVRKFDLPESAKLSDPVTVYVNAIVGMEPYVRWSLNRQISAWNFFLPFSGVTNEIENQIKKRFVKNYHAFNVNMLAAKYLEYYETPSTKNESLIGIAIDSLLGRIKIIEAVLAGESLQRVLALPTPGGGAISFLFPAIPIQQVKIISNLEYFYIFWLNEEADLNARLGEVRQFLEYAAMRDKTVDWIIPWAAGQPGVLDVWLSDFWTPTSKPQGEKLSGPYTIQGKNAINLLIERMNAEPILNQIYGVQIKEFQKEYEIQRGMMWRQFLLGFDIGRNLLLTSSAWRELLSTLGSEHGPYARLADRILMEYPRSESIKDRPEWVSAIEYMRALRQSALNTSWIGELKGKLKVLAAVSKLESSANEPQDANLLDGRGLYKTYADAMDKALNTALSSPGNAASLAIDFSGLGNEPSIKTSQMRNVADALQRLEDKIGVKAQPWNSPGWVLLEGNMKTTLAYAYNQAACSMQAAWNGNVVYQTKLATSEGEMYQKTFGEQGTLWNFIDKTAKPFLTIGGSDFINIVVDGWYLNWDAGFITFLNNAASEKRARDAAIKKAELEDKLANTRDEARIKEINTRIQDIEKDQAKFNQTTFTVKIDSIPVQTNSTAKSLPYGAAVTLSCGNSQQRFTQLNFSASNNFNWKANSCGDTELQIFVGEQTLVKVWSGEYGFSQFLSEFQTGKKTFLASKFPEQSQALEQLGIKQIDVLFKFSGANAFVEAAKLNQNQTAELVKIKAEKAKLEKAVADRQVNKIANEIASLMNSKNKPVIPEKVANCPY